MVMFWLSAQIDPNLDTIMAGFPYVMPLLVQKAEQPSAPAA